MTPVSVDPDVRRLLRQLAVRVVGPRLDHEFLVPVLLTTLRVELNDFVKLHQTDASDGFDSPAERQAACDVWRAANQAWEAQPQQRAEADLFDDAKVR